MEWLSQDLGSCMHLMRWEAVFRSLGFIPFRQVRARETLREYVSLVCDRMSCAWDAQGILVSERPRSKLTDFRHHHHGKTSDTLSQGAYAQISESQTPSSVGRQTRSMSRQSKKRIDVSSTGSFFFILFQFRGSCIKVRLQHKLSVIGPFAPRRRKILCGSRSSRFPLFNLRLFWIPAFILIERAALNRRFFLFSVGKATKGSFSAVDKWSQLAHVTYFLSLFIETRPLPLVPIRMLLPPPGVSQFRWFGSKPWF